MCRTIHGGAMVSGASVYDPLTPRIGASAGMEEAHHAHSYRAPASHSSVNDNIRRYAVSIQVPRTCNTTFSFLRASVHHAHLLEETQCSSSACFLRMYLECLFSEGGGAGRRTRKHGRKKGRKEGTNQRTKHERKATHHPYTPIHTHKHTHGATHLPDPA